jgi:glycine betaine/proline transport system ATP-binding protein
MVPVKEVAYLSEGPTVVLRRMRQLGQSHMFVVDDERRLQGLVEVEEVARLAERNERELRAAVDGGTPKVERSTYLREILPLFVERDVPVAVCDETNRLEGVVVRGALIAGLTTTEYSGEDPVPFEDEGRREGAVLRGSEVGQETDGRA